MLRLVLIIALCLMALPAQAAQCSANGIQLKEPALCSRTFDFSGTCGIPKYNYPHWDDVVIAIGAWEKVPIRIITTSADAFIQSANGQASARIFAGNSYNDDPMTPSQIVAGIPVSRLMKIGQRFGLLVPESHVSAHVEASFPLADGMQFPAGMAWPDTHLDVHLYCLPKGAHYSGSLSVWYKLDP